MSLLRARGRVRPAHRPRGRRRRGGMMLVVCLLCAGVWSQAVQAAGATREARHSNVLRVCADPGNLPFSSRDEKGFENRIASLLADELGRPLQYHWWPQTIGFVRNTLRVRECDVIIGIATGNELVQNTNPYYRSVYAMVFREDAGIDAESLSDPVFRELRLGVVAGTPPATLVARYELLDRVKPYLRTVDTRHFSPARQAIEDVARGEIDVALIWGPIAGYYATRHETPLTVRPLVHEPEGVRLDFRVSMAVRHSEQTWKRELNTLLRRLQPQIDTILAEYGVPLLDEQGRLVSH